MSQDHSVTQWIQQLRAGESAAVHELWIRYLERLTDRARRQLRGLPRRAADEEDVALSAFEAFFRGVQQGRFARLQHRDDLWQILVMLTDRKAIALLRHERAHKRGQGRNRGESALELHAGNGSAQRGLAGIPDPSAEFVDQFVLDVRERLDQLDDDLQRQIAIGRLEGYTVSELAERLGISHRSVERKLQIIRRHWQDEEMP